MRQSSPSAALTWEQLCSTGRPLPATRNGSDITSSGCERPPGPLLTARQQGAVKAQMERLCSQSRCGSLGNARSGSSGPETGGGVPTCLVGPGGRNPTRQGTRQREEVRPMGLSGSCSADGLWASSAGDTALGPTVCCPGPWGQKHPSQPAICFPSGLCGCCPWSWGAGASLSLLLLACTLLKNVMFATVIGYTSPRGLAFSGRWGQGPGDLT